MLFLSKKPVRAVKSTSNSAPGTRKIWGWTNVMLVVLVNSKRKKAEERRSEKMECGVIEV